MNKDAVDATLSPYRQLPSVDELVRSKDVEPLLATFPRAAVVDAIRGRLDALRRQIASGQLQEQPTEASLGQLYQAIREDLYAGRRSSLVPVLNASGVLLHTNLGRAPLSAKALENVARVSGGYCNLEFSLASGERSKRDVHIEQLLLRVLAARCKVPTEQFLQDRRALIVNNCAAATFLVLNTLSPGKETIISRGELLEIGGGFRIPDILAKSGAILREVGTTNRTRVSDYASALGDQTALLLKVHPANFAMTGFVEAPALRDLATLAHAHDKILFEDQGTGCLLGLDEFGVTDNHTLIASLQAGVDIVVASGDKLLGGPQCGFIVGSASLIEQILENPLLRTFRVDKMVYAALESTLLEYQDNAIPDIPLSRMLRQTTHQLRTRARIIKVSVRHADLALDLQPDVSLIGGGTTPSATLETVLLVVYHAQMDAAALALALRSFETPIVPRTFKGAVALDLRTLPPEADSVVIEQLNRLPHAAVPATP